MNTQALLIPISIVVAGAIVAGAVVFTGGNGSENTRSAGPGEPYAQAERGAVSPAGEDDHIYGEKDAAVSLIEYSDFECPFCRRVHPTLKEIVDESDGEVNWVYRHLPLASIHTSAVAGAVASECMARLGGNDAFWMFADSVFENQRAIGQDLFEQIAQDAGVGVGEFRACFENTDEDILSGIQDDLDEARGAGGRGTPYTIVKAANGTEFPVPGAVSKQQFLQIISRAKNSN